VSHQRPYRGLSAEERISERRERLLTAGMDLFGTRGFAHTTIEQLCAAARVSTRAFYECFDSRDDLLVAVHDRIVAGSRAAIDRAVSATGPSRHDQIRARLTACVSYLTEDPRRIRVSQIEMLNLRDPFAAYRRTKVHNLTQLLPRENFPENYDSVNRTQVAVGLLGAIDELLVDWVQSPERPSPETLLASAEYLCLAALDGAPPTPAAR
jgi:AcrR family transcriptional regulator